MFNHKMIRDYEKSHPEYRTKWRKVRLEALERDNHTCRGCGVTQTEILENPTGSIVKDYLNVAHIGDKEDIRLEMLITLCWDCNKDFDGRVSIYDENGKSTGYYYDDELRNRTRAKLLARTNDIKERAPDGSRTTT